MPLLSSATVQDDDKIHPDARTTTTTTSQTSLNESSIRPPTITTSSPSPSLSPSSAFTTLLNFSSRGYHKSNSKINATDNSNSDSRARDSERSDTTVVAGTAATSTSATGPRRRTVAAPFVSRHRQELDRIKTDATHSRSHPVPDYTKRLLQQSSTVGGNEVLDRNNSDSNGDGDSTETDEKSTNGYSKLSNAAYFRNVVQNTTTKWCQGRTTNDWIATFLPAWRWLSKYDCKATFASDLIAGLTVGVMVVPQSMSYAKLAGLPVQYGLYSALVPVYAYSLFGSSRQLAVGPVAIISLLLSTGLSAILTKQGLVPGVEGYDEAYIRLAIQTSFLVGVTYIIMGLVRLGFVTIFLSHAVISGFTTGAAVIIGLSQLKYILGYNIERSDRIYEILIHTFQDISEINWKTFVLGCSSILLLVAMKNAGKSFPRFRWARALGPLTVTVLGIVLVAAFDLQDRGIAIVGTIPRGLPVFTGNLWTQIDQLNQLIVVVISITIVGFMESIAIAKQLAAKHKYEIDASLELLGLGMSNFMGAMFQAYPVTGSFSRSAVNHESGAETGISGVITASLVALVLLFLTPIFEKLPLCILAAIVISGVLGLLDYPEAIHLWKVHKFDFAVWLTACLGTMFLGVEIGLAIAVGVSLLIVIYESAYPHTAVIGRLPGTSVYRNIKQYPEAERYDGIIMVRIDAPLYFANAQNVRDKIRKYRKAAEDDLRSRDAGSLRFIILELTPVSHIDTSALHLLQDMFVTYKSRGQQLCFSNPSILVMKRMATSGFVELVGRQHFFSCSHDALNWCLAEMDMEALSVLNSAHGRDSPENDATLASEMEDAEFVEMSLHTDEVPRSVRMEVASWDSEYMP